MIWMWHGCDMNRSSPHLRSTDFLDHCIFSKSLGDKWNAQRHHECPVFWTQDWWLTGESVVKAAHAGNSIRAQRMRRERESCKCSMGKDDRQLNLISHKPNAIGRHYNADRKWRLRSIDSDKLWHKDWLWCFGKWLTAVLPYGILPSRNDPVYFIPDSHGTFLFSVIYWLSGSIIYYSLW